MANVKDPGLGSNYNKKVDRFINEDGSYNIVRHGGLKGVRDFYKYLIEVSWPKFLGLAFISFVTINLIFAILYIVIGVDQISGLNNDYNDFLNAFFFSSQTLTSLGYGSLSPSGLGAGIISSLESFVGLMGIALITGLLYGRFSRPSSKIIFSKNVIIRPFGESKALMFKMVNQRNSILLNTKIKTILILDKGIGENAFNKEYHNLSLQLDIVDFFPLTWTLVHKIDKDSPLFGLSLEEIQLRNAELIALVEAFDETHSQSVVEKHSFGNEQWIENMKFDKNYRTNDNGQIELYINELNNLSPLD
ncbi:MAG: ion channel [Crocinitomicaceae bacterium]|nr:ion channel [Crocinitomicaceae bacterium]